MCGGCACWCRFIEPGEFARLPGLPVLSETVGWLVDMGVTVIRQGGSFTQGDYYLWKVRVCCCCCCCCVCARD